MASVKALVYSGSWWALLVRGIVAAIFGIVAIANPGGTVNFIIRLLGIVALIAGIVAMVPALKRREDGTKTDWTVVPAVIAIVLGLLLIIVPQVVAGIFIFLLGLALFIYGVYAIYSALRARKDVGGGWMPFVVAVVLIIGIILMAANKHFADAFMWLLGLFALILGILWIAMGIQMRSWAKKAEPPTGTPVQPAK